MPGPADNDRPDSDAEDVSSGAGRGLWDIMRQDGEVSPDETPSAATDDGDEPAADAARPRSLWSVIENDGDAEAPDEDAADASVIQTEPEDDIEFASVDGDFEASDEDWASEASPEPESCPADDEATDNEDEPSDFGAFEPTLDVPTLPQPASAGFRRTAVSRRIAPGSVSLSLGGASVALSLLCLLSLAALRILPTLTGVGALIYGCLAVASGRRRSSEKKSVAAVPGIVLGLLGIFAGPLWLNEAGDRWRHEQTSRVVTANLRSVGAAFDAFHDDRQHFPAGGSFVDSADGFPIGMHGWMTDLLPHLGHVDLAAQIDRRRPWSDPVNAAAMSTRVEQFLTPDTRYALTSTGHAPAHFAGVGGRVETEFGTGDLGVLGRDSRVTRDDVIDGLSQTMVAGEISETIPAWGEPDNWRRIGPGLNQSPHGFGNATNSGAHFLMGDGSVRFLPNRTSLRTLQQLSTRNGSE